MAGGGAFDPGLIDTFGGIKQTDAAVYIAKGVAAVVTGGQTARGATEQGRLESRAEQGPWAWQHRRSCPPSPAPAA